MRGISQAACISTNCKEEIFVNKKDVDDQMISIIPLCGIPTCPDKVGILSGISLG
jgi:hypothetical protein